MSGHSAKRPKPSSAKSSNDEHVISKRHMTTIDKNDESDNVVDSQTVLYNVLKEEVLIHVPKEICNLIAEYCEGILYVRFIFDWSHFGHEYDVEYFDVVKRLLAQQIHESTHGMWEESHEIKREPEHGCWVEGLHGLKKRRIRILHRAATDLAYHTDRDTSDPNYASSPGYAQPLCIDSYVPFDMSQTRAVVIGSRRHYLSISSLESHISVNQVHQHHSISLPTYLFSDAAEYTCPATNTTRIIDRNTDVNNLFADL